MLKRSLLFKFILCIFAIVILILIILNLQNLSEWISTKWIDIFYAFIFAVVVGVVFEYSYNKLKPKPKISKETILAPKKFLARLILPDNKICLMSDNERIFGREDFLGTLNMDSLEYIGNHHFKILKKNKQFYLTDLNSKNGTKLNDQEIKGRVKLSDGDQITVANILEITFKEEK
ncbi:FHA domain-containing protein [uncultured Methanobacterium sp.]|uniref:FHA domain-containing protein n=1 Tax=uncultured Methanobacterium sp. TaxID=176306 RepID=UPI002AA7BDDE|nr:FHA domain-containing protein [uncultured Methanobacterium sp.]